MTSNPTLVNYSAAVTTTPAILIPSGIGASASYLCIINNDATNTLWISLFSTVTPSVGGVGCFPIGPGVIWEFKAPARPPSNIIRGVSSSGTVNITVMIG